MTNITLLIIELSVFLAVFFIAMLAERALGSYMAVRRRLGQDASTQRVAASTVLKNETLSNRFLIWVQSATAPKDPNETSKLRRELSQAGFEQPSAPVWYVIGRFGLAIGLPLALIFSAFLLGHPLGGLAMIVLPLVVSGLGMITPYLFISNRAKSRRQEMENEFPDALDLMVVCVEAGLGLEAAFVRVAREVHESHPRLAFEFGRLAEELSAGRGRADALRLMAERVGVDSVKSFVALLIQSESLGVSIAQSLRTYSGEMRESRFLKAEEKAMRVPVLLTMPIVACFMPVIVAALLLPPAIDVMRTLLPTMSGNNSPPPAQTSGPRPGGVP
jgi:tight adherence protein C